MHLTRRELEELAAPLIERSLTVFATALSYASVASTDLHSILLVGAASRMPRIAEALRERFDATIALDSHPKFAVCLGAAIWADGGGAEMLPPPGSGLPLPPPTGDPATTAATTAVAPARSASRRKWWLVAAAGVGFVAAIAVVGAIVLFGGGGKPSSATVTVRGDQAWTETSIDVSPGDSVTVEASGTVNLPQAAGPAGDADPALTVFNVKVDGKPLEAPHGALIGKVGSGAPFVIGDKDTFQAAAAGRLSLGVNDEGVDNNSGSYQARIHVDRP